MRELLRNPASILIPGQERKRATYSSSPSCPPISLCKYGTQARLQSPRRSLKKCSGRTLADTHDRGALDATDFAIGMYFIQHVMSGHISFIPTSLPPGLYQQAGGVAPQATGSVATHMTGGGFPPQPSPQQNQYLIQPNMTGNRVVSTPSLPAARPAAAAFGSQAFGTAQPGTKANSDKFFDGLDAARRARAMCARPRSPPATRRPCGGRFAPATPCARRRGREKRCEKGGGGGSRATRGTRRKEGG